METFLFQEFTVPCNKNSNSDDSHLKNKKWTVSTWGLSGWMRVKWMFTAFLAIYQKKYISLQQPPINLEKKKQTESKYTNHNPQTWPLKTVEVNLCLLTGLLRWLVAAKQETVDWTESTCYWNTQ